MASFAGPIFLYGQSKELPSWTIQNSGTKKSARGASADDGQPCWLGTKGAVLLTTNGGY